MDEFSTDVFAESNWPYGHAELGAAADEPYQAEIGADPYGGAASDPYSTEIGADPYGGAASDPYSTEIGADPYGGAASDPYSTEIGADPYGGAASDPYSTEIGAAADTPYHTEIGAAAVAKVIEKARDNRQPPPQMRAVDVEAPLSDEDDFGLLDTCIGEAVLTRNPEPYPLLASFLQRAGAGMAPRVVRVDTEASYARFRAEHSPEIAELRARMDELARRFAAHTGNAEELAQELDDVTVLGAVVDAVEADKRVPLWLPPRFAGYWEAWRQGDQICASIKLPGFRGDVLVFTSLEPLAKALGEMERHAAEARVPTVAIGGALPALGCMLGAGTAMKEMAAAAPAILARPEAKSGRPFVVRIEPKANPALCALCALLLACVQGNAQACDEWQRLSEAAPPAVKQAMGEARALLREVR